MSVDLRDPLYRPNIAYLKKEAYSGSMEGLRFRLKREAGEEGEADSLSLVIWPEPYCFEKTADEEKHSRSYSFDEEGLEAAISYLMSLQGDEK
ncbi:MAG: hypothetical protein IK115_00075 [Lachnospiraceae bacterium]|nr:hypothetical protein [Lachnospiraceae bacterium]